MLAWSVLLPVPFVAVLAGWSAVRGEWAAVLVLAVSLFAVVAYSWAGLRFKERPFLDAATSATHFVSPAVYGLALAGATPTPALAALLGAFFLWGMASQMFGAVQDVVPDREGAWPRWPPCWALGAPSCSPPACTRRRAFCCWPPTRRARSRRCWPCPTW